MKKYILSTLSALLIFSGFSLGQPPPCDTCNYDVEQWRNPDRDILIEKYDSNIGSMYIGCDPLDSNRKPGVAFIHGLGGDIGSWFKQVQWTDTQYNTAAFGVDYGSSNYEVSFNTVATEVNVDLYTGLNSGVNASYPNRCKLNDFVIAHSQGGLAARYLDRQWDVSTSGSFGDRKFRGIVTFGTPNGGAHIAYTKDDHFDFVQGTIRVIFLDDAIQGAYDLTGKFGYIIGKNIYDLTDGIDSLLKKTLAPLMLSPQHTNTLDEMRPDHQTLLSLKNHNTMVHRVAFFGIEEAPECWRVIDNIVGTPATDYDVWGAQPDTALISTINQVHADHIASIAENKKRIKRLTTSKMAKGVAGVALTWGVALIPGVGVVVVAIAAPTLIYGGLAGAALDAKKIEILESENKHRQDAIDFLNNANTQWRFIIGSYNRDSFSYDTTTYFELSWKEKYGWLSKWYDQKRTFNSYAEADAHYTNLNVYKKENKTITSFDRVSKKLDFYPSDGIVLAKSQKDFPNISEQHTDLMESNNHMQERNSLETYRVLKKLYEGGYDPFFDIDN